MVERTVGDVDDHADSPMKGNATIPRKATHTSPSSENSHRKSHTHTCPTDYLVNHSHLVQIDSKQLLISNNPLKSKEIEENDHSSDQMVHLKVNIQFLIMKGF